MFTIDQITKAQNFQMEAIAQIGDGIFESATQLASHNFKAGQAMMGQAASSMKTMPQAGQFNAFMNKQAELMKPWLDQVRTFNAKANDAMEAASEYMTPSKPVRAAAKATK